MIKTGKEAYVFSVFPFFSALRICISVLSCVNIHFFVCFYWDAKIKQNILMILWLKTNLSQIDFHVI